MSFPTAFIKGIISLKSLSAIPSFAYIIFVSSVINSLGDTLYKNLYPARKPIKTTITKSSIYLFFIHYSPYSNLFFCILFNSLIVKSIFSDLNTGALILALLILLESIQQHKVSSLK